MTGSSSMTLEQEAAARDTAFHILKKYTSFTFLDYSRNLYQQFLNAFFNQLDKQIKNQDWYESKYRQYLQAMMPLENGLSLLTRKKSFINFLNVKPEAYKLINQSNEEIGQLIDGRGADHFLSAESEFFRSLGCKSINSPPNREHYETEEGVMRGTLIALRILDCLSFTQHISTQLFPRTTHSDVRAVLHWDFENINAPDFPYIQDGYDDDGNSKAAKISNWPLAQTSPKKISPCPAKNLSEQKQIMSGKDILKTGIYEPWLDGDVVGCPNYFLAGQAAIEYQLEGTETKVNARWRLIWEDTRYLDGIIPEEENSYFNEEPVSKVSINLRCAANEPCPKAGFWFTPAKPDSRRAFKEGEIMPDFPTEYGHVIWQWDEA